MSRKKQPSTDFRAIIAAFPSQRELAREMLGLYGGNLGNWDRAIWKWKERNMIPAKYWQSLISVAPLHGIHWITERVLVSMVAQPPLGRGKKPARK